MWQPTVQFISSLICYLSIWKQSAREHIGIQDR
jgi:hypothetical protein